RRRGAGGQGAPRLRPDQSRARRQRRPARAPADHRGRADGPRRHPAPRAAPRHARRRFPGAADQGGRSVPGVHAQLRLRRARADRSAGGFRARRLDRGFRIFRARGVTTVATKLSTEELLDVFKSMSVLELNEFLKAFEEEFDVTAAAPVAVAAGAAAGAPAAEAAEQQDEFDVVLAEAGSEKIKVI